MEVEICFLAADAPPWRRTLQVAPGTTVGQAIARSEFAAAFPAHHLSAGIGVFGRLCGEDQPLNPGDRVEIYRRLVTDPKEARRRRAADRPLPKRAPQAKRAPRSESGGPAGNR
jgi:putative ubiquitin-RnfH superfamily antitoxin RatB of RatAB toxin-antitoxin module